MDTAAGRLISTSDTRIYAGYMRHMLCIHSTISWIWQLVAADMTGGCHCHRLKLDWEIFGVVWQKVLMIQTEPEVPLLAVAASDDVLTRFTGRHTETCACPAVLLLH